MTYRRLAPISGLLIGALAFIFQIPAQAQNTIQPDATLGTEASVVVPFNEAIDLIGGGARRGDNLFHSFETFSIGDGNGAYFITPTGDVDSIFARITGGDLSTISGVLGIRQNGVTTFVPSAADLVLINPNGILFGENAVLDVGGSFTATTASGVQFGDAGQFNAVEPEVPPVTLSINPSAYFFNSSVASEIVNHSVRPDLIDRTTTGLRVPNGETLALLSNSININGQNVLGGVNALGGSIEIGAVGESGSIGLTPNGRLIFPEDLQRGNILLQNNALIDAALDGGGSISLTGQNISLSSSFIRSGIRAGNDLEAQAGDINLDATGSIRIAEDSAIINQVRRGTSGSGGNINLSARTIDMLGFGSSLTTSAFGTGNAGSVTLNGQESVNIEGGEIFSRVGSQVGSGAVGNGGDIKFNTDSLNISGGFITTATRGVGDSGNIIFNTDSLRIDDGSTITTSTFSEGNSGDVTINARNAVFEGFGLSPSGEIFRTAIFTNIEESGSGNGGHITINTETAQFLNTASLFTDVRGIGNGGNIVINTGSLLLDGAQFQGDISGMGDAGNIVINASQDVIFRGQVVIEGEGIFSSIANSSVESGGVGNGGNIHIFAQSLSLSDGAQLQTDTESKGNAGNITLIITGDIHLTGMVEGTNFLGTLSFLPSGLVSTTELDGGQAGDIIVRSSSMSITDGANIRSETLLFSQGDAGDIEISVKDSLLLEGTGLGGIPSRVSSATVSSILGQGGNISINAAGSLRILEGAEITTQTVYLGGDSGDISVIASNLDLNHGGRLVTSTRGLGQAGNINLDISGHVEISGQFEGLLDETFRTNRVDETQNSGVFASTRDVSTGDGGNITIQGESLSILDGGVISSRSEGTGSAGGISITTPTTLDLRDGNILTEALSSFGGNIEVSANQVLLSQNSDIVSSVASGAGRGGNIVLLADSFIIALDDSDILAFAADGAGGNITLQTPAFFGQNFTLASLTADPDTLDGNGRVDINATGATTGLVTLPDVTFVENNLNDLTENIVVTDQLLAGSCIARTASDQGSFLVTGGGGLPVRPGDNALSAYPTGQVQDVSDAASQAVWNPGDPITEPTGAFELANGRLVLSRECEGF